MKKLLTVKNLSLYKIEKGIRKMLFKDVSFTMYDGDVIGVVGPSASGRTSLLRTLAGLENQSEGSITFHARKKPAQDFVAMAFEEPALLPWLTIEENIHLALEHLHLSEGEAERRIDDALETLGMEGYGDSYPFELSRSLQMKAALARTFAQKPLVLVLDEPFSKVDALSRIALKEELLRLVMEEEFTKGVVFSSNSVEDAVFMSDEVIILDPDEGMKKKVRIKIKKPRNMKDKKLEAYVDKVYQALLE